jgi:hypothetical protein
LNLIELLIIEPFSGYYHEYVCAAQRLALAADKGRVQIGAWEQKKLEARKLPVKRADSPPSAARIVRQCL